HNLISNAVKYTVSGGVLIGCRKRGEQLSIEIWDTGPGIPGEGQTLIFEEFYQLGNPARDQRKGYGLGLAIVKRLGNLLNHEVVVRSREGKGSVFSVLVPRGVKNIVVESTESTAQATVDSIVSAKNLYIEDDPAVLESLNLLLKMQGYSILSATNGQTALNLLREESNDPDIIITDYRLPGGELGTSVVREINAVLDRAVPTIFITGDTAQIELLSDQAPGWRILHKPVKGEQLIRVIHELLPDQKDLKRSKFHLPHIVKA
ncbi:MAG: ATP-binding protein, partial [Gammaproteobacteria bacterium]|nr:ATP-binding protein [Gammaproteobacteria bacterium]